MRYTRAVLVPDLVPVYANSLIINIKNRGLCSTTLFFRALHPLKNRIMKDELTTAMHAEFLGDEINDFDLRIMSVYGAISRGISKQKALEEYNLTEDEYDKNIVRVLS